MQLWQIVRHADISYETFFILNSNHINTYLWGGSTIVKKVSSVFIIQVLLLLVFNQAVLAEEAPKKSDWEFNLAPFYLWVVTLEGDVVMGPAGGNVSLDFEQIFDNLEAAFIVHFETTYKDKFGFLFDTNYIDIGSSTSLPTTDLDIDLQTTLAELVPYYRLNNGDHKVDFLAGILYSKVSTDVGFSNLPQNFDMTEDWVDPYIGIRWGWKFADGWGLSVKGAIGGFGVSSDLIWEGAGLITWQPWKYANFLLGYRAVGIDYTTGSGATLFEYDVTMSGPILGINFTWP